MSSKRDRPWGRVYSGILIVLTVAVIGAATSALYVSAGGEAFGWTSAVFGIQAAPDSTEARLQRARSAAWDQRYDEALAAYDTVLAARPGVAGLAHERARVLAWAERYGEAADALAAAADTGDVEASLERARYLWWAGRPREADSLLSVVLVDHPGLAEAVELQNLVRPSVEPARTVAERWVAERPDDPFSRLWLARALVHEGRAPESLAHYRRALVPGGGWEPEVILEAAGVAMGADSLRLAAELLSRYLYDVDPDDRETRLRLARAYAWSGRYDLASEQYDTVLATQPDPSVRLELARMLANAGRDSLAAAELRRVLAEAPGRQVRRELAASLARSGQSAAAIAELRGLVAQRAEPDDLLGLAHLLARSEQYGDAADVLTSFLELAPEPADSIPLNRARYLWWAGRLDEADAALTGLAQRTGGDPAILALREEVREGIDASVETASRWTDLDDTPRNRLRLARALVKARRHGESLEHYRAALAASPDLLVEVVDAAQEADSLDLAVDLLEGRLRQRGVTDPDLMLRLGRLHAWAGRPEEASRVLGMYLAVRPADREARFERGRQLAWQDSSRWAEAATELERVVGEDPGHAPALKLLGDLRRWQGEETAALAYYRRAAAIDPELEGLDEGIRLATAAREAEAPRPDVTRVAMGAEVAGFSDSHGFDWAEVRARHHWMVGGSTVTLTVGQAYSGGRSPLGTELDSFGFSAAAGARVPLAARWSGTVEAGFTSYQESDTFATWSAGFEYQDSLASASLRYDREPAVREATTIAALRADAVLDRVRLTAIREAGGWRGAAELQAQRFGADAGDGTRFAGMLRLDRSLGAGLTAGAMVRGITADGAAPVIPEAGPLYWSPRHYIAPALTLGYGRPLPSGFWLGLRAAPGYAWIDERENGAIRYEDGETAILEAGATLGFRRGRWSFDLSGDWGGNLGANAYDGSAVRFQISRSGGAR